MLIKMVGDSGEEEDRGCEGGERGRTRGEGVTGTILAASLNCSVPPSSSSISIVLDVLLPFSTHVKIK